MGDADDSNPIYVRADGTLHDPFEAEQMWLKLGLARDDDCETVFVCGGGWRASLAWLYARLAGWEQVRVLADGWSGWSTEFVADAEAGGTTPGWRQVPTSLPRVVLG